jgi:hypothetical protein
MKVNELADTLLKLMKEEERKLLSELEKVSIEQELN